MAVAELCLNEGKQGLGTTSGIEARHTDGDKSEKEVISLLREGLPTYVVEDLEDRAGIAVKPVRVILEAIEVVEWRATSRVVSARASPVGVEIPLQSHGAHGEPSGIGRAMEIAHRVEAPVLMVHEPIEGVGGTMRTREAIGARELRPFAAECEDHLPERAFWQPRRGPLAQPAQPLGGLRPGAGIIDRPDPAQDKLARGRDHAYSVRRS